MKSRLLAMLLAFSLFLSVHAAANEQPKLAANFHFQMVSVAQVVQLI